MEITTEERRRRAMAVENMYRLYKKYYPIGAQKGRDCDAPEQEEADEESASFC